MIERYANPSEGVSVDRLQEALSDPEHRDVRVATVARESFTSDDGWSLGLDTRRGDAAHPNPGDTARLWGRGIGAPVRGLAFKADDGPWRLARYQTDAENREATARWLADEKAKREAAERANPTPDTSAPYTFTAGMREISGFGGRYEQTCRNMLGAALRWLDAHPKADPQFHGYKGIYGILAEDNKDAKALSKAAVDAAGGDCSGAMHQAVLSHALWIRKNGWGKFCEGMRADAAAQRSAPEDR